MRFLAFVLMLLPFAANAQADSSRNSIGLFAEAGPAFGGGDNAGNKMSTVGLQYTRRFSKSFSYAVVAGYASSEIEPVNLRVSNRWYDTFRTARVDRNAGLAMLGANIEGQRQFFRRLCFFGGLSLRAGYGSGKGDTVLTKEYNVMKYDSVLQSYNVTKGSMSVQWQGTEVSMFYAGFTPYFGLKLEFKRFSIGTCFMNYVTFKIVSDKARSVGMMDFNMSDVAQQFFVRYKF